MTFSSNFWRLVVRREPIHDPSFMRENDAAAVAMLWQGNESVLMADGEPKAASSLIHEALVHVPHVDRCVLPYTLYSNLDEALVQRIAPNWGFEWDLYYADSELPVVPGVERVEFIERNTPAFDMHRDRIIAALRVSNPITSALDEVDELDWFVIREGDDIVSLMGAASGPDLVHFAGLGTLPAARGKGYGGALMVAAVNFALKRAPIIQFGVWSWNTGALRLYDRLGLVNAGRVISGKHQPFPNLQQQTHR